jgi:integrase/recombinase XerD
VTFQELTAAFTESRRILGYSKAWQIHARLTFEGFRAQFDFDDPRQLKEKHLIEFKAKLASSDLVPSTVYMRFRILRALLRWATAQGYLLRDPGLTMLSKKPPEPLPAFVPSQAQMLQLLAAPDPNTLLGRRDRVILEVFYGTGLRRQELLQLQIGDFQRQSTQLWVRQGKGCKDRLLPLGDHLLACLEDYLANIRPALNPVATEKSFFLTNAGTPMLRSILPVRFRRYVLAIGLPQCHLHSLRHAYATHLLEGGAKIHEVGRLLGHTQLKTTERYTQVLPLELMREYRRTHPRARRRR